MKKNKIKLLLLIIVMSTTFVIPTYANPWFGWHSNNDCITVAMPSDSKDISACIGGTETRYFFGIPIGTRPSAGTYGQVH